MEFFRPRPKEGGTANGGIDTSAAIQFTISVIKALPEIEVRGNNVVISDGDISPSLGDFTKFGAADVLTGTVSRTFQIFNNGAVALAISDLAITGTHSRDFAVTNPPAGTVAPGDQTAFTVTFDPRSLGGKTATVAIDTNAGGTFTFAISGIGSLPVEVTTGAVTNVLRNTADGAGSVVYGNDAGIFAKGLVWSTASRPSVALHPNTTEGGGTGEFTSAMTGLTPNTTYNVRAYAQAVPAASPIPSTATPFPSPLWT